MLFILLMVLIDKFKHRLPFLRDLDHKKHLRFFKIIPVIIICLLITGGVKAQNRELEFQILKNDKSIGILQIEKKESEATTNYHLSSKIEASFIKKFRIRAKESFSYKNGQLVYSSVERSINDKIKGPKELVYKKDRYIIKDENGSRELQNTSINSNLVLLYFEEPLSIQEVYCDNQQAMVDVQKIGNNQYRIDFPDGASNVFNYQDGKCIKVDVYGKFFKVELRKQ